MQNNILTAPGKITHFFTDDTMLSAGSSLGAPHGHFSDLKLQRDVMPSFAMQADLQVRFTVKRHATLKETETISQRRHICQS